MLKTDATVSPTWRHDNFVCELQTLELALHILMFTILQIN